MLEHFTRLEKPQRYTGTVLASPWVMILVADQNRVMADMLVRRLRTDGFDADSAPSSIAVRKPWDDSLLVATVRDAAWRYELTRETDAPAFAADEDEAS